MKLELTDSQPAPGEGGGQTRGLRTDGRTQTYVCWYVQLRDDSHSSVVGKLEELLDVLLSVDHVLTVGAVLTEARQVLEVEREALRV